MVFSTHFYGNSLEVINKGSMQMQLYSVKCMLFHSSLFFNFLLREAPALFHCTFIYLCRVCFDIKQSKDIWRKKTGCQDGSRDCLKTLKLLSSEENFVNMHAACVVCTRTHNLTLCLFSPQSVLNSKPVHCFLGFHYFSPRPTAGVETSAPWQWFYKPPQTEKYSLIGLQMAWWY